MTRYARMAALIVAAGALTLTAMACGDDDEDGDDADPTAPAPTQPAAVTAEPDATEEPDPATTPPVPAGGAVTITAADFSFAPTEVVAAAGVPVRMTLENGGDAPHTLTVYADEDYTQAVPGADSGQVSGGDTAQFEVTLEEGEYFFRCEIHPDPMQGVINVN